jgi:arginine repressor
MIRKIISDAGGDITQEGIQERLENEYGVSIGQSSISRSIKKAKIIRDPESGKYVFSEELKRNSQIKTLKKFLAETNTTSHQCSIRTLKTKQGFATAIAALLEETYPDGIIGTVAQNSTVLVAYHEEFTKEFQALFAE